MSSSSRKDASGKRGGFTSLNLHQSYRGGRPELKGYSKGHGLQSLGRIGATSRRMPAPASLPSLRSENAGNDPTISLVPSGGSGWNKKEDKENKEVNSEVRQLGPEKPPKSPGKKFKTDFPSLEEQEAMSKRELEELERRHREEQELRERERGEERERSPESGGGRSQGWRDPPPPRPHGYHGPLPPPNMGPYPPRGPYPPHPYPPYMLPPPPPPGHGMPPYRGVPPMHGNPSGRYPPPHHMQFRPPFHHSGYPPPNPYEMDPYKMPSRKGDDVSRPPTVKADDLKSMDVPDEEEGGWAGHHEEVDYTKEVIFSDSSDDESSSKLGKGMKKHQLEKPSSKDTSSKKEDTGAELLEEQDQEKRRDSDKVASAPSGKKHNRDKARLPSHNGDYEGRNWGEQRPEGGGGWGDFGPDGNHPKQMPPYHFPQYPYPPPPPPPYGDPFAYAYQRPSGYSMPRGYPPPSQQRFVPQRGTKRGHSEREEAHGRHDFHPWTHDMDYRPKRKWSGDEERPRILSKSDSQKSVEGRSEGGSEQKEKSSALKRTDSASSDTQGKHHVTFADDVPNKSESPTDDQISPTATTPVMMRDTKKIVMRKLGDSESDKQDQPTGAKGSTERPKDLKTLHSGELRSIETSDSPESRTPDSATKVKQMAWNVNDRGPITSPKTLYEPEGRRSEAKFNKYRRDAGEITHKGKGEKGVKSPGTPLSETEQLKEENVEQESQKEDDAVEKKTQTVEKEGGGKPIEKRIELKPGPSDRPRRRERERQDSRDKARHHKDDARLHEEDRAEVTYEKNRERGRDRADHRKLDSFGRYGNQPDAGWERGDEKEGYRSREFRRGQDQDRDKSVRKDSHHGPERGEGEGRRDHYGDAKQQNAWKERHPSRSEPPRRDSKTRREERRPREGQKRYENPEQVENLGAKLASERLPTPVEKSKDASEQLSSVSGNEKCAQNPVENSSTGAVENPGPHLQPLLPTEDGNPPKQSLDQKAEQKHSRDSKRENDEISLKPSRGGQRGGDDQTSSKPFREGQRGGEDQNSWRPPKGGQRGEDDQMSSRPPRGRQRGGDQEREWGGGGHPSRERERDQGGPQRDRDRKQRPYGKQQPPRGNRETSEREREGRQSDRRAQQDTRSSEHGEKHDRHSGRQRDRHPPPQQRRHPPRGAERVQERGADRPSSQSRSFERTRGKRTGDGSEEVPGDSRHNAPEKARGTPGGRVERLESPADTGKRVFGYGEVIDIESGSDWEEESFQVNQAKPTARKQLPKKRGERGDVVSASSSAPPRTEQGEKLQRNDRRQSREERGNPRQESGGRDFKRGGAGRGRGRVEDGRRERRGPETSRPGSYSSQRRQPSSASREESRDSSKQTERHVTAESAAVRVPSIESLDDLTVKSREKGGAQSEKKSESFHKSEFEKYDLNSLKVSIVDEIGSEFGEEAHLSPTAQAEFVQVTSKKTQKEKHKKEKEEQQKQDEEKRRHEEERSRRPRKSARPPDKPVPSQSSSKPLMAWGATEPSNIFWGTGSSVTTGWSAPLLPPSFAAPGAQLKSTDLVSNWPEGAGGLITNVGVIGDSLQSKGLLATPGNSKLLGSTAPLGSSYSLFGGEFIRSPLPPSMTTSSMLDAAVDSTMPGLSEDALRSTPSKDPLVRTAVGTSSGDKDTQTTPASDEKEKDKEGHEFQKVERSRGKGKSLPPRFQNSKPPLLPQPPQQQQLQQQQQRTGRGRGERRGGERRGDRSSGSSSNKSDKHTQSSGGSSDDRFYVHPRARGDASRGGQKSGSSGGGSDKRRAQHNSKPPLKSGSEKATKVVSGGGLETSCDPSPDLTEETFIATTGQQSPRAGSGSNSSGLRATSNEDRVNLGNCKNHSALEPNVSPSDFTHSPNPPNPAPCTHFPSGRDQPGHGSARRDTETEKNKSLLPRNPSLRYSKDNPARPEGHVALHMQRSRLPPPSAKSISYADALKTKFTPPSLSTSSNSTVSLRSQTPSESSSLLHHDVKDALNLSIASSRCSTPAQVSSKQASNLSPGVESEQIQGSESRSHSVQSNAPDSTTETISVPQNVEEPKLATEDQVVEELRPPSAESAVATTQVSPAGGRDHSTLVDKSEKCTSDIVCHAGNVQEPEPEKAATSSAEGEDSYEAINTNKVASEPHDMAVMEVETAEAEATPTSLHATTVSQTDQSEALSIEMPTVPQLLKAKQHTESSPSSPDLSLNSTHLQQGIFSESLLTTSQSTSQPAIPEGALARSDNMSSQAGFQLPQVSVQQEEVLNRITPQPPSQLPANQATMAFYSGAEVCTKSFTSNTPQDSLSQSQQKQQYVGVLHSSPDAPTGSRPPLIRAPVPVPVPIPVHRPHTTVAALNQQQQQQAFNQHFIHQHLHQLSDIALYQRQLKLAHLQSQAHQLNHPEIAHIKNLNTMVGLMPNDSHLKGYPLLVQRFVDTPQETVPPNSNSVLGSYHKAASVLHPGVMPPGHVPETHFIPSDAHPGVVYVQDAGGVVASQQERGASKTPPDRDQRGESVESSKSGLSITATPFIPASETQTPVSSGLPIPPPRKVISNPPEGSATSVPIVSVPQQFSHPPGFEGPLLPPVIFQQSLPMRAPHTLSVLPTATPLIGHHPIPPQMAAAMQPIPVIPRQQLHVQRKSPLPTPVPSQPIQSTEAHSAAAAYQIIALQHFQRQSPLQEQLPNHPKMTTLLQPESHIPHRRKPTHPLIGERASANAMAASLEMQAKRMPLSMKNPRTSFNLKLQNPIIPLGNSGSKRPLLPTPPQSFVSPTSHMVSPGQSWQVRVPHAPPVQIPFPHEQHQRASSLYTYGTSGQY